MACLLRNGLAGALAGAGRGKVAMGGWQVTCALYMASGGGPAQFPGAGPSGDTGSLSTWGMGGDHLENFFEIKL